MKKLGILLDSFSGYSKKEIEAMGFDFIPQVTILDGTVYEDGITLILKDSIELIKNAKDVKTSMPSIGLVSEKLKEMSNKYEQIVYYTMNRGMSSTYSTGVAAALDFHNVKVISNKLIGTAIIDGARELAKNVKNGKSLEDALKILEKTSESSHCFVIPKNVSALIKSGRLTGAKRLIMEKAKLIPRLRVTIEGFKLDSTKRGFNKIIKSGVAKIVEKIGKSNISKYNWEINTTGDNDSDEVVANAFRESGIVKFTKGWVSIGVAAHSGIGAIGINTWKK